MTEVMAVRFHPKVKECFNDLLSLKGVYAVALGNWKTGACLAYEGANNPIFPNSKIEIAVAGNTKVIQAKMAIAKTLGFDNSLQDFLISLTGQWHLIKILSIEELFIYIPMDRSTANIAALQMKVMKAEQLLKELGIKP